jgi:hypothetical protein
VIVVSTLAMGEPDVFRVRGPAAILAFVACVALACGEGIPLRRLGTACAVATMVVAFGSLVQLPGQVALGALIVALQLVLWAVPRRARR